MVKSVKDRILEALKKEALTEPELSEKLRISIDYPKDDLLLKLEDEGLIKYDLTTEKWHLKGENVAELEKDPKFRKWIVENLGMKWRNYVLSKEDVREALRNIYLEMKHL